MILGGNVDGAMPERARAPLERACRGGQREGCALLKRLEK
jgi:hypothetical protein